MRVSEVISLTDIGIGYIAPDNSIVALLTIVVECVLVSVYISIPIKKALREYKIKATYLLDLLYVLDFIK